MISRKYIIKLVVILLAECTESSQLKVSHYCRITPKNFTAVYDTNKNFNEAYINTQCHGSHGYQCGPKYCSKNQSTCLSLINMNKFFMSYIKTDTKNFEFQSHYKSFYQIMKNCSQSSYELKVKHLCLNGKNCYVKHVSTMRFNKISFYMPIECPCPEQYSYKCQSLYCTANKHVCESVSYKLKNLENKFKSCGNNNLKL